MSVDIGICSFQKGCTHLYICMKQLLVCIYKKEIFIAQDGIYINILLTAMDIVDQCSYVMLISVFGCHTNAFILKCT